MPSGRIHLARFQKKERADPCSLRQSHTASSGNSILFIIPAVVGSITQINICDVIPNCLRFRPLQLRSLHSQSGRSNRLDTFTLKRHNVAIGGQKLVSNTQPQRLQLPDKNLYSLNDLEWARESILPPTCDWAALNQIWYGREVWKSSYKYIQTLD